MKKLKWRLSNLPTPLELQELVKNKILTQEEAREILFKEEEVEKDRDLQSFKDEIKFLRDLVETLSKSNRTVVYEHITSHYPSYPQPWYQPYYYWGTTLCGGSSSIQSGSITTGGNLVSYGNNVLNSAQCSATQSGYSVGSNEQVASFSDIKTF
jgi:hypothetical protein